MIIGAAIDFSGISLPFSITDLVRSGNGLLGLVGAFVLLGMAFVFVPKLIESIRYGLLQDRMNHSGFDRMESSRGKRAWYVTKYTVYAMSQSKKHSQFWNE